MGRSWCHEGGRDGSFLCSKECSLAYSDMRDSPPTVPFRHSASASVLSSNTAGQACVKARVLLADRVGCGWQV